MTMRQIILLVAAIFVAPIVGVLVDAYARKEPREVPVLAEHCKREHRVLRELEQSFGVLDEHPVVEAPARAQFAALANDDFELARICIDAAEPINFDMCALGRGDVSCMRATLRHLLTEMR